MSIHVDIQPPSPKRLKLDSMELEADAKVIQTQEELTENAAPEVWVTLHLSWAKQTHVIQVAESDRVLDLKEQLNELTSVPPERQKILGLVKGKLPPDEATIRDLKLTSGRKFSLIGTPVGQELQSRPENMPDVMNDLDIDVSEYPDLMHAFLNDQRNLRKIREATDGLELHIMNPPREGKRLLVLDLDYTLMDTKPLTTGALPPSDCARPGLHAFLESVYPYYDICIWSQTSWVWLETKLVETEMVGSDKNYKISFVLDKRSMFKVFAKRDGKVFIHAVKALQIIWNKFPYWNASNTIHIDDLARNFALNPPCGLKIAPFNDAQTPRGLGDHELPKLAKYLVHIANTVTDFKTILHKDWKHVVRALKHSSEARHHGGSTSSAPAPPKS